MQKRQGSILILALIVMLVLSIFSSGVFMFAHANYRSAEQQRGIMKARAVADSLLFSVGSVISDDLTKEPGNKRLPVPPGEELKANLVDGPIKADVRISQQADRVYVLTASAKYGPYQSGERMLQIVKKNLVSGVSSEWIWK